MLRSLLAATVVGALILPAGAQAQATTFAQRGPATLDAATNVVPAAKPGKREPTYNGNVIVKFRPGALSGDSSQADTVERVGKVKGKKLKVKRKMGSGAALVEGATPADAVAVASTFDALPDVEYAEPDRLMTRDGISNDTYTSSQWDLGATPGINVTNAWARATGRGVVVAVVDTGILAHPDLAANTLPGYDFISSPTIANDGDGRDGNAVDPGDAYGGYPSSWHGTHVAGTIAAVANNGVGVAGIAYDAKILPARALGVGGGYMSDIADAIVWSSGAPVYGVPPNPTPAQVVNLSLGAWGACSYTEQGAINTARSRGTVVVTAAGNEGADASTSSPGNCSGVVNVAAVDSTGVRASYSNYGSLITLAAPGSSIMSTWNSGTTSPGSMTYGRMNGTSMAAPHVAGAAALLKSLSPTMTPDAVKSALAAGVNPPGSCSGCGAGLLDAGKALAAGVPLLVPTATSLTPAAGPLVGGNAVTIAGTNLDSVSSVLVGGVSASIDARTGTSLTVTVPARSSPGAVPVVLKYGASTLTAGNYTYVAVPVVSYLTPSSGSPAGGTKVTITGSGFIGATGVAFGGRTAEFTVTSATSVIATVPAQPAGGTATPYVTVTTPYGTSAASARYTYASPTPYVYALSVRSGSPDGGNAVTVTGQAFTDVTKVTVGGVEVEHVVNSATSITIPKMPAMANGVAGVYVVVSNPWKSSTASYTGQYTYVVPVPTVSSMTPSSGSPLGSAVTLTGTNFTDVNKVTVGGSEVAYEKSSDNTKLTLTVPALPAGATAGSVTVVPHNKWVAGRGAAYTYAIPTPYISALSVRSGNPDGGNAVTVTGQAFTDVTKVTVGGVEVEHVVNSATSISIPKMPAMANGVAGVYVVVRNPWKSSTASYTGQYTYVVPVPTVSSMTPSSGSPLGSAVTLAGTNFAEVDKVTVNGVPVEFSKNPDNSKIILTVPALPDGSTAGSVTVVPHNKWVAGRGAAYTYAIPTPYVYALSVRSGNPDGGNAVTVTGQAFTDVTTVTVGGASVEFTVNSGTSITIRKMPAMASGVASVYVVVRNPWKSSTASYTGRYMYVVPVPTVSSMTPSSGSPLGGAVTLAGTNFADVHKVTVGGAEVAYEKSSDNTRLTLTVPALPEGATTGSVPVVPHNKWVAGRGATYTYAVNTPSLWLSQSAGKPVGGDRVKLTGSYLADVTEVWFGASKLDGFDRNADGSLTVTVPRYVTGAPTTVSVVAKTPWRSSAAASYRYLVTVPYVSQVSPATGATAGGETVLIGGSRLADVTKVMFGDVAATQVTVVSAYQLRVVVPPAAEGVTGKVPVTVSSDYASSAASTYATYTYVAPAPTVPVGSAP